MQSLYEKAGSRIYNVRLNRGYTRECLAEMANISPKFLYEIETGKKGFSAGVLYNIAKALEVDCNYIMTGTEEEYYELEINKIMSKFGKEKIASINQLLEAMYECLENE